MPSLPKVPELPAVDEDREAEEDAERELDEPILVVALRNAEEAERAPPVVPPESPVEAIEPPAEGVSELVAGALDEEPLEDRPSRLPPLPPLPPVEANC